MNKKISLSILSLLVIVGGVFGVWQSNVFAATEKPVRQSNTVNTDDFSEIIDNFRSDITINRDGSAQVVETIDYDFKEENKHGIFRTIPFTDAVGTFDRLSIDQKTIKVTDNRGNPYQFTYDMFDYLNNDLLNIKIGDPHSTLSGKHTYVISYTMRNALGFFDDRTELYWNVTGNEWEVPIWNAETHIYVPGELKKDIAKTACYYGMKGSKAKCDVSGIDYDPATKLTEVSFSTPSDAYLNYSEGVTVAVGFPKEFVVDPATDDSYFPQLVRNFKSDITINHDNTINVTERIDYDFKKEQGYGIYRALPFQEIEAAFADLKIKNLKITDETGRAYPLLKNGGIFSDYFDSENTLASAEVGDKNNLITGPHTYIVSYTIINGIGFMESRDRFSWNTTGDYWRVPIWNTEVTVTVPGKIDEKALVATAVCGAGGSKNPCKDLIKTVMYDNSKNVTILNYKSPETLHIRSHQGLVLTIDMPQGTVAGPTGWQYFVKYLRKFWFIPFPFIVAIVWFRKTFKYWLSRRKYYQDNTIIAEYDAGDMDPLEVSGIVNGSISNENLSAQIISLAVAGYIKIKKIDGEYSFEETQKDMKDLNEYDQDLLKGISGKKESDLANSFYETALANINSVTKSLAARGYIETARITFGGKNKQPGSAFGIIFISCFLAINPGAFVWLLAGAQVGFIFSASCILIGILLLLGKPRANRLTPDKGFEAERKLLGLKYYIEVAEDARIKFHNAPEKTPELFEKLLPYAMVFGLEKKWAKEFEGIYTVPPKWYSDGMNNAFAVGMFASSLSDFSRSTSTNMFSSPVTYSSSSGSSFGSSGSSSGSSGGGSSGGGGGGGGGGSW